MRQSEQQTGANGARNRLHGLQRLLGAAEDLNQRLQDLKERTRVTNTEQLVFIAALNISYELTQEKAKTRDYASSMEQRIRMLQQTIEQALLEQGRISERPGSKFE